MRKTSRGLALPVLVGIVAHLASAHGALADETRRGFFFDAAAGVGVSVGVGGGAELSPFTPNDFLFVGDLSGPALNLTITPAYVWSDLAAGLGLDATYVAAMPGSADYGTPGATILSASAVGMLGSRETGVMGMLGFGPALALLRDPVLPSGMYSTSATTLVGWRASGRLGYVFPNGFGVATVASYAHVSGEAARYDAVTGSIEATFTAK